MKSPSKIPKYLYLVRSKSNPKFVYICTEMHLAKWVNAILAKGEEPDMMQITPAQLFKGLAPNPQLN